MQIVFAVVTAFVAWKIFGYFINRYLDKKQYERLLEKYRDSEIAYSIMRREFWQGQTAEQLIDSIGKPYDIDRKVLKSKTKETWKYKKIRRGQFALRVILENDVVIGWEDKS